eukprot:1375315-Pyramimonas_sp.AAC.2
MGRLAYVQKWSSSASTPKREKNRRQGLRRKARGESNAVRQADIHLYGKNEFSAHMDVGRTRR